MDIYNWKITVTQRSKLPIQVRNICDKSVIPLDIKVNMMSTSTVFAVHFGMQGSGVWCDDFKHLFLEIPIASVH